MDHTDYNRNREEGGFISENRTFNQVIVYVTILITMILIVQSIFEHQPVLLLLAAMLLIFTSILLIRHDRNMKRMLANVTESEQKYKSIVEHNPAMICSLDCKGQLTSMNYTMEMVTGYKEEELLQKSFIDVLVDSDIEKAQHHFAQALNGAISSYDLRILHKSGKEIVIGTKNVPILIDGNITGMFFVGKDITKQKMNEDIILRSEKLSVLGELAAGVAHEIRNPITSLKGFLQLIKSSKVEPKQEYLDLMLSEIERITFIVSEFMLLSKPQAQNFQKKDVRRILQDVVSLLNTHAILKNEMITLNISKDLPIITCEENQLKQVFMNILKNAIEATPSGKEIIVQAERWGEDAIIIHFKDQGPGIPPELIKKLGEPFYTTKEKGTGLGLMVCFKIVEENHNGKINISSKPEEGTTVDVILPISNQT